MCDLPTMAFLRRLLIALCACTARAMLPLPLPALGRMQPVVITSVAPPQEQAPVAHVMSRTAETTPAPDDGDKECGCAIPLACPSQDHWGNREPSYPCCGIGKNWVSCMGCIVTDFCCFICCFEKGAQKRAERYARQSCRTLG